jgi:Na+/H+ antiporter NhaD/arsenite permease-like protein
VAAALILVGTYTVIALGRAPFFRIDRTGAAIVGAILMVVAGGLPFDEAVAGVDARTIVLLFGMMVLVAHLRMAGFFGLLARAVTTRIASPAWLLAAVVFASGILSALFVNDTVCLVFAPIVIEAARAAGLSPLPLLLGVATGANIGSVATITGNPQNMLIGTMSRLSYVEFASRLAPVALLGLAADAALLAYLHRADLRGRGSEPSRVHAVRVHRPLLVKALLVAAGMLAGFLAGLDSALVAAAGAAVLLVTRRVKPERVYRQVDWDLLVLFVGLFVVVAGVRHAGLTERWFAALEPLGIRTVVGLAAVTAILSNAISNVPAVMLLMHVVPGLPDPRRAWLTLAMASALAGNLTLVGSIANLIVVQSARREGVVVSFWDYLRVGVPITLVTMTIGLLLLM